MNVDYIIIGQGICGTWLSYFLLKANKSVVIIDKPNPYSASNIAGGLINPVTGRRVVTTWMAEELMPFNLNVYRELETAFNTAFINQKNMLVFPAAPDLQQAFYKRLNESNSYILAASIKREALFESFNFPFNVFETAPCYVVQMQHLLNAYRQFLKEKNNIIEDVFNEAELVLNNDCVEYKNMTAKKVIYANGAEAAQSKYWKNLPFVQNKGQALVLEINEADRSYTYKFGNLTLIPWKENLWWAGSSNELEFENDEPTENFKQQTIKALQSVLKLKFAVHDHVAALRPATVERRPFAGEHALHKQLLILNGMGSKGCSLAPWFAKELAENIVSNKPINVLADVKRYAGMLRKHV